MNERNDKAIKQMPTEALDWGINWACRNIGSDPIASATVAVAGDNSIVVTNSGYLNMPSSPFPYSGATFTGGVPELEPVALVTFTVTTVSGRVLQEVVPYICITQRIL